MTDVLNRDMETVKAQALLITGGMTFKELGDLIAKALGYKTGEKADTSTLDKPGGKSTATTTTDPKTGERVYLANGILEIAMSRFNKGGKGLKVGDIVKVGTNGGIIAVPTADPTITKKSGTIKIENIDPINNRVQYSIKSATGGLIKGPGTGTSDSIPAMLSNGEFVINAKSAQNIGYENLHSLNNFAMGGLVTNTNLPRYNVGGLLARSQRLMMHTGGTANNVTIGDIVINAAPGMDERQLAKMAAQEVFAVMSNRQLQIGQQKTIGRIK